MRGKHYANKREWKQAHRKDNNFVSNKSDNRVVCNSTGRMKFLYPSVKKAELACSYSKDPQRPYYCKGCCGWHTTSKSKDEYYQTLDEIGIKGFGKVSTSSTFVKRDPKRVRILQQRREKLGRGIERVRREVEHTMRVAMWLEYPYYQ